MTGEERIRQDMKGEERTQQVMTGEERIRQDMKGEERIRQDMKREERTQQVMKGEERITNQCNEYLVGNLFRFCIAYFRLIWFRSMSDVIEPKSFYNWIWS